MRPNLNALKVFCVVASVRSFTHAAQLLHVTQGAVSQQIANLEKIMGMQLFEREARSLNLTRQGRRLYLGIKPSLERIDAELDAVLTHKTEDVLRLTTLDSFGAQWLIPRIPAFEAQHPEITLHIDTSLRLVDLAADGIDLGIRYGGGEWPGLRAERVLSHRLFPIAGAAYAAGLNLSAGPASLAQLPLYYDLELPTEWPRWFHQIGLSGHDIQLARGFSDTLVMLSALRNGLEGVALIGDHLTQTELSTGVLVRLFDDYIEADGDHYLIYPQDVPLSTSAATFRDWILQAV